MITTNKRLKSAVIKNSQAKITGKVKLEKGRLKPCCSADSNGEKVSTPPKQVSVVETTKDYILLEIGCECGNSIKLKCNYADFFND